MLLVVVDNDDNDFQRLWPSASVLLFSADWPAASEGTGIKASK